MLNILFNPKRAKNHPFSMMIVGIFYSSISILLSSWIFPEYSSLIMVFFTVISCLYVVQGSIKQEERKEMNYKSEKWLLKEHSKILFFFLFLFIGFVISFTFWTIILSDESIENLLKVQ